jgi:hypothetical protein
MSMTHQERNLVPGLGLLSLVLTVLLWGDVSRAAAEERHSRIHVAIAELRNARTELQEANHDFGGHRVKAIQEIDATLVQLEKALMFVGDKRPFKGAPVAENGKKAEHFPHIHRALHELRETRTELKEARHDFGGHREQALMDVNASIAQLELCLKFARAK